MKNAIFPLVAFLMICCPSKAQQTPGYASDSLDAPSVEIVTKNNTDDPHAEGTSSENDSAPADNEPGMTFEELKAALAERKKINEKEEQDEAARLQALEKNFTLAISNRDCEKAAAILDQHRKLSSSDVYECRATRDFLKKLNINNAQKLFLAASDYEDEGQMYYATVIYKEIKKKFPESSIAVKAAERLSVIRDNAQSRQDRVEVENRVNNSIQTQRSQDAYACSQRKASCNVSCWDIKDYDMKSSCLSRCESIC